MSYRSVPHRLQERQWPGLGLPPHSLAAHHKIRAAARLTCPSLKADVSVTEAPTKTNEDVFTREIWGHHVDPSIDLRGRVLQRSHESQDGIFRSGILIASWMCGQVGRDGPGQYDDSALRRVSSKMIQRSFDSWQTRNPHNQHKVLSTVRAPEKERLTAQDAAEVGVDDIPPRLDQVIGRQILPVVDARVRTDDVHSSKFFESGREQTGHI